MADTPAPATAETHAAVAAVHASAAADAAQAAQSAAAAAQVAAAKAETHAANWMASHKLDTLLIGIGMLAAVVLLGYLAIHH